MDHEIHDVDEELNGGGAARGFDCSLGFWSFGAKRDGVEGIDGEIGDAAQEAEHEELVGRNIDGVFGVRRGVVRKELGIERGRGGGKCRCRRREVERDVCVERPLREQLRGEGQEHVPAVLEENREEMEVVLGVAAENGEDQLWERHLLVFLGEQVKVAGDEDDSKGLYIFRVMMGMDWFTTFTDPNSLPLKTNISLE